MDFKYVCYELGHIDISDTPPTLPNPLKPPMPEPRVEWSKVFVAAGVAMVASPITLTFTGGGMLWLGGIKAFYSTGALLSSGLIGGALGLGVQPTYFDTSVPLPTPPIPNRDNSFYTAMDWNNRLIRQSERLSQNRLNGY